MWWTLPTYFDFTWALITVTRTGRPDLSQLDEKLVINQHCVTKLSYLPASSCQWNIYKKSRDSGKNPVDNLFNYSQPGLHILTSCEVPIDTSRTFFDTNSNCLWLHRESHLHNSWFQMHNFTKFNPFRNSV